MRNAAVSYALLLGVLLLGGACGTSRVRTYPGPTLPREQVSVVRAGWEYSKTDTGTGRTHVNCCAPFASVTNPQAFLREYGYRARVVVHSVDGRRVPRNPSGMPREYEVQAGERTLLVSCYAFVEGTAGGYSVSTRDTGRGRFTTYQTSYTKSREIVTGPSPLPVRVEAGRTYSLHGTVDGGGSVRLFELLGDRTCRDQRWRFPVPAAPHRWIS